jgi:hypothetical protein
VGSERFERGFEVRRAVVGKGRVAPALSSVEVLDVGGGTVR